MGAMLERMAGAGKQFAESFGAVRQVFANPNLRRIELAFAGSILGNYAGAVVIALYAFRTGGVTAVSLLIVAKQAAAAAAAPLAATLADRFRRERVMLLSDLSRVVTVSGIAILISSGAPSMAVYVVSVASSVLGAAFGPAEKALVGTVARTPQELTAANVASSTFDSVGIFAGPAIGAAFVALSGYTAGMLFVAGTIAWSALQVARVSGPAPAAATASGTADEEEQDGLGTLLGGFRAISREPRLRLLIGVYAAQLFVAGALSVLEVAVALDLLHTGTAGFGLLQTATGVGAIVGAGLSLALLARARLGADLDLGLFLWGAPLVLIGAVPNPYVAGLALAVVGAGNSIVDIATMTLVQRTAPSHVAGRVFGVLESVIVVSYAVGALLAPVIVHVGGLRAALLVLGPILPVIALLAIRPLTAIDRGATVPEAQIAALRSVPFLALLPVQTIELLASRMRRVELPAGETLFSAGDHGDSFYVLDGGRLAIALPGGEVKHEDAPGYVGEIALLRDVPRTATVRAESDASLWVLGREDFLAAVGANARASARAENVVVARLGVTSAA
jgi:MFS family permease